MQKDESEPINDGATTADSTVEKAGEGGSCATSSSRGSCEAIIGVGDCTMLLAVREKTVQKELSAIMLSPTN